MVILNPMGVRKLRQWFITLGSRDFSSAVSGFCQIFIVTRGFAARSFGPRPSPKIPAVREKNLWYPG